MVPLVFGDLLESELVVIQRIILFKLLYEDLHGFFVTFDLFHEVMSLLFPEFVHTFGDDRIYRNSFHDVFAAHLLLRYLVIIFIT